jgi:glycosyltransferase involved in cell wall biosynthesis
MRIAMLGSRGVPATLGGVERHVEEVGACLVERGHEVVVFCRSNYVDGRRTEYRGMRLRHLPTVGTKHLDTISHTALSTARALRGFDVVHYHAMGPGLLAPVPRLLSRGTAVVQTIHGLDAERAKWGPTARRVLRLAEWVSARVPDATIVVSQALEDHYRSRHGRTTTFIPNGVAGVTLRPADMIARSFGLEPGGYLLFVGRLVPEKQPDLLIRAFARLDTPLRLVVAGGSSFTDAYVAELQRLAAADPRVLLTGPVHGPLLDELYSSALAFATASSLEGAPLALLEAISTGLPVVASDIAPHVEVLGGETHGRRLFTAGDEAALAAALQRVIADGAEGRAAAEALRHEVVDAYGWPHIAEQTECVYRGAVASVARRRGGSLAA